MNRLRVAVGRRVLPPPRSKQSTAAQCWSGLYCPMQPEHASTLQQSLARLQRLDKLHLEIGKAMLEAYGGAIYGMDLLASGALNRSMAHISGFAALIERRNLICAGALLRLQLDTALRFFASFLVDSPHDFAVKVLGGTHVRGMCDRDGERLTDAYLVSKLGAEFEWVPRVYDRTSGYVHLSSTHLMAALSPTDDGGIEVKISAEDKPLPDWLYIEASDAFCAATEILLKYVHGWVFTKANPKVVARWRKERFGEPPRSAPDPNRARR